MEYKVTSRQIKLNKELNELDNLVIDFVRILNKKRVAKLRA